LLKTSFEHPDSPYSTYQTQIYNIYGGFMASIGHKLKHMFINTTGDNYFEAIIEYKVDDGTNTVITKDCTSILKDVDDVMEYLENTYGYRRV